MYAWNLSDVCSWKSPACRMSNLCENGMESVVCCISTEFPTGPQDKDFVDRT
jgi:hypothetical protein